MRAALSRIVSISSFAKMFFTYFKKNLDANSLDDDSRSLWSQNDVLETEPPFDHCILDGGEEVDLSKDAALWYHVLVRPNQCTTESRKGLVFECLLQSGK